MSTKPFKLAFAAALVISFMYSLWTIILKLMPYQTLQATGHLIHLQGLIYLRNYVKIDLQTTLQGAVYMFLFVFIVVLLTALVYRALEIGTKKRGH